MSLEKVEQRKAEHSSDKSKLERLYAICQLSEILQCSAVEAELLFQDAPKMFQ